MRDKNVNDKNVNDKNVNDKIDWIINYILL